MSVVVLNYFFSSLITHPHQNETNNFNYTDIYFTY